MESFVGCEQAKAISQQKQFDYGALLGVGGERLAVRVLLSHFSRGSLTQRKGSDTEETEITEKTCLMQRLPFQSSFFEVALFKSENTAHRAHQQTLSTVMAEQLLVVPSVQAF